jgi:YebC/PmpR family DNA-binding regulatory protein
MSGHSKWANIKNRKGAQDKKRSTAFTKAARDILTAIRLGGGNTNALGNNHLRVAIEKSRQVNMPKENIDRLIKRFEERKDNLTTFYLEGFGPETIPVMIEVETDNKNRTLGEIKLIFRNHGGSLGSEGSVAFMFDKMGRVELAKVEPERELELIDAGAQEMEGEEVWVLPEELNKFVNKMNELGIEVAESGLVMRPKSPLVVEGEENLAKIMDFIEELEENEDVVAVAAAFTYKDNS